MYNPNIDNNSDPTTAALMPARLFGESVEGAGVGRGEGKEVGAPEGCPVGGGVVD